MNIMFFNIVFNNKRNQLMFPGNEWVLADLRMYLKQR